MLRASRELVITPNAPLMFLPSGPGENTPFGNPRLTWFRTLNDSKRNCRLNRSPRLVFLITEKSQLWVPGTRTSGRTLLMFPNVKAGGFTNCVVSNQRAAVRSESLALVPVEFGLSARKLLAPRTIMG